MEDTGKGRLAVIIGGGNGIGAATAQVLSERGWKLAIVDRDFDNAQRIAAELGDVGLHPAQHVRLQLHVVDDLALRARHGEEDRNDELAEQQQPVDEQEGAQRAEAAVSASHDNEAHQQIEHAEDDRDDDGQQRAAAAPHRKKDTVGNEPAAKERDEERKQAHEGAQEGAAAGHSVAREATSTEARWHG